MHCPHCNSVNIYICKTKTQLNYLQYRCRSCCKQFNERTGTDFNFIEYPNEVVIMTIYYYFRFKLSLDDVVEVMKMRGFHLSHQTAHNWSQIFGVALAVKIRAKRAGNSINKWNVDAIFKN